MKKIGIAVMILAVIGVAVAAGVFVTGHPETTKVEQKHEKRACDNEIVWLCHNGR